MQVLVQDFLTLPVTDMYKSVLKFPSRWFKTWRLFGYSGSIWEQWKWSLHHSKNHCEYLKNVKYLKQHKLQNQLNIPVCLGGCKCFSKMCQIFGWMVLFSFKVALCSLFFLCLLHLSRRLRWSDSLLKPCTSVHGVIFHLPSSRALQKTLEVITGLGPLVAKSRKFHRLQDSCTFHHYV